MRLARLASLSVVLGVVAGATFFACGGGDDGGGGGGGDDANGDIDAKVFLDAPMGAAGIGTSCMPSMDGSGQGTCPVGYTCLSLMGGTGGWCSKSCMRGSGDTCATGYAGPGVANCIWDIQFGSNSTAYPYCGVICQGTAACGSNNCDGTCPGATACTYTLMTGSSAIGSACR
jgi:hypothetical protein